MLNIKNLKYQYDHSLTPVINMPSWQIEPEDIVFLSGRSGAGKSTLINLIAGLLTPDEGTININGSDMAQLKPKHRNRFRADHIGLISQQFNLIPYLSVLENIQLAQSFRSQAKTDLTDEIGAIMDKLDLNPQLLNHRANELSIGQQQRVAIIRAIINQPELILADEPTSALDYQAKTLFIELLKHMVRKHRMTLLFISHDLSLKPHFPNQTQLEVINAV